MSDSIIKPIAFSIFYTQTKHPNTGSVFMHLSGHRISSSVCFFIDQAVRKVSPAMINPALMCFSSYHHMLPPMHVRGMNSLLLPHLPSNIKLTTNILSRAEKVYL